MRKLVVLFSAVLASAYGAGAAYFFVHESWASSETLDFDPARARHPEALLAAVRDRLASHRYGSDELSLLSRVVLETPSFYQGPFLLAAFRENRLETASAVRDAYESAIARYPANGRLHLAYGNFLLDSRSDLSAWRREGDPPRLEDPRVLAEIRLRSAMELEPELTWRALATLAEHDVPPERWVDLVPEDRLARRHLVDALFQSGRFELGWHWLEAGLDAEDAGALRRIVQRGLDGGSAEIALTAAERWLGVTERERGPGPASLEPALWLARAQLALDEPERAYDTIAGTLERLDAALGRSSKSSLEFLCSVGDEYLRQGQAVSAESWFGEAAARSPTHVPALYGLGRSLRATGDLSAAADYYEQVLRLDSAHDRARNELEAVLVALARR